MTEQLSLVDRVHRIEHAHLIPMVKRAVGKERIDLVKWSRTELSGSGGGLGNAMVFRFSGKCRADNEILDWSLILKVIREQSDEIPSSSHYWKREFEAYQSGWLDNLPGGGLAAPLPALV
jgi:hypothetical protein